MYSDIHKVIYMEQLEAAFRAAGITVPLSSNEKGQRSESWSTDYQNVGKYTRLTWQTS